MTAQGPRPLLYTDVETHPAAWWERWSVIRLMWAVSRMPDLTPRERWAVRRLAARHYILTARPLVSYYVWTPREDHP